MGQVLHGCAATTHAVRAAIQRSTASTAELSRTYGLNPKTVAKWRKRDGVDDAPMGPKEARSSVLSKEEEALAVAPLALNNLALAYNPQAGTLDTNANIGNLENQLINDPGLILCTVVNSIDPTGALCDLVQSQAPRAAVGTGARSVAPQVADPTLGGLVEVTR